MRILVYGAGVQGCELAHRLLQNKKNVVTMLARG
jgi:2-dehydropantoate 2-reductase